MGCHAGINGLRTGEQLVGAEPGAVVLHICLELCSLHLQTEISTNAMLSGCLFGDGCSAVVYGHASKRQTRRVSCLKVEGDMKFNNDFRGMYATLLEKWMGMDAYPILGANYEQFDLIRR